MTETIRSNPYVGPRAFEYGETLYGRDQETTDLLDLLIAERIVMLYSPSGAGKSSLLKAALIPALEKEDFHVLPAMRVSHEPPPGFTLPSEINRYIFSLLISLEGALPEDQQMPLDELAKLNLSEYLTKLHESPDKPESKVLIFDQFEEILTIDPANKTAKEEFFTQIGSALRARNIWAIFSLREDFIAGLDSYLRPIPTRLKTTFRLELLGEAAAREALQKPARLASVDFTDAAAIKLVNDLRKSQVQQTDGSVKEQIGMYVEPVQLQVVCRRLWDNLLNETQQITEADIEHAGDVDNALASYYAQQVQAVTKKTGISERVIREWCGVHLITEQGIRGQVLKGIEKSEDLDNAAIYALVDTHLVRAEERRGATWFELAHDRLIKPIKANNAAWQKEHLSMLQRQAELWDKQERSDRLLLRDELLSEAEQWAKEHPEELSSRELDFLEKSREARAIVERERRQTRRIRLLAIWSSILAIIAFGLAVMAYIAKDVAIKQRKIAHQERDRAAAMQKQAEKEKNTALRTQSQFLANLAAHENIKGNYTNAMLLAMEGLPKSMSDPDRPYIAEAEVQLYDAVINSRERGVFQGHDAAVYHSEFSQDGQRIVTGSWDKTARVWDTNTFKPIAVLKGHELMINHVTFSSDGQKVLTISWDKTARIWDATTGKQIVVFKGHEGKLNQGQFSPDERFVVTASHDETARIWDANTGIPIVMLTGHQDSVNDARFSPDGHQVITASRDNTLRLWDAHTGKTIVVMKGHDAAINHAEFSKNGKHVISASWDKTVRVWDVKTGNPIAVMKGHERNVVDVKYSPDNLMLVTASDDGTARVWDANTGSQIAVLKGHQARIYRARFSPDNEMVITASQDNSVRLWNAKTGNPIAVINGHEKAANDAKISPDGKWILTTSMDKTARLWDINSSNPIAVMKGHESSINNVRYSPDGQHVVTASSDKTARVWDVNTSKSIAVMRGHEGSVNDAIFSPDSRMVITISSDKTARVWHADTGKAIAVMKGHEADINYAACRPDSQCVITVSEDKTARVWDANTGNQLAVMKGHEGGVNHAKYSPDGQRVLTASSDGTAMIWDAATGNQLIVLKGHESRINKEEYSPDGHRIVTVSDDKTARIWDAATGNQLIVLKGHESRVYYTKYSPDGKKIITTSDDKTTRVWDEATGNEIAVLKGHKARIYYAIFSPNSQRVITVSEDGTARVWDVNTGGQTALIKRFESRTSQLDEGKRQHETMYGQLYLKESHEGIINRIALSPDGLHAVTSSKDGTLCLWRIFPDTQSLIDYARKIVPRQLTTEERKRFFLE